MTLLAVVAFAAGRATAPAQYPPVGETETPPGRTELDRGTGAAEPGEADAARRPPALVRAIPADAGTPCPAPERLAVPECAATILNDSRAMIERIAEVHAAAQETCLGGYVSHADPSRGALDPDAREPCGALSEQLWNTTRGSVDDAVNTLAAFGGDSRVELLADVDCDSLDEEHFGAAVHVATVAPAVVSHDFFRCAIRRESRHEEFPLWSLLSVIRGLPEARTWVPASDYRDDRTLRRLSALE